MSPGDKLCGEALAEIEWLRGKLAVVDDTCRQLIIQAARDQTTAKAVAAALDEIRLVIRAKRIS